MLLLPALIPVLDPNNYQYGVAAGMQTRRNSELAPHPNLDCARMRPIATRAVHLGTEIAFEVRARAPALEATGHDIIHLEIGEPDFDTPRAIVAARQRALGSVYAHHTPPLWRG